MLLPPGPHASFAVRSAWPTLGTVRPELVTVEREGLRIRALDWGGTGEPLFLLHPNGFCGGVWAPLAERLRRHDRFRPVAVDFRGQGASDRPRTRDEFAFASLADDVVAVAAALGIRQAVAAGVSLGGGVAVLVDRASPGLFTNLFLHEPIVFASSPMAAEGPSPMVEIARKRRAVWPDRDTMRASYGSRPPLAELDPSVLDAYLEWGTVDQPDGTVRLACDPDVEAGFFELSNSPIGALDAWQHLPSVTVPLRLTAGRTTNLPAELFEQQAARAGVEVEWLETGHFGPLDDLDLGERLLDETFGGA